MAAKKGKKIQGSSHTQHPNRDFMKTRFEKLNVIVNRLEGEVESLVKKLVHQGERSSRELRKNFDEIFSRLKKTDFFAKAQQKTDGLEKEVRRLADEIVDRAKNLNLTTNRFATKKFFKDARRGLDNFVGSIEKSNLVSAAKHRAENTRNEILSFLSIPSQNEVTKLEKKISTLERRLQNLSQKAA